jgi:DNA polymerase-3 subunit epsilon
MVRGQPNIDIVLPAFHQFCEDTVLIAHNAAFDMRFLNHELEAAGLRPLEMGRVVDTLELARKRFPGAKHSLDALCQRFQIDRSARVVHGALIDAELLADVYIELTGGRQIGFDLAVQAAAARERTRVAWPTRVFEVPAAELAAHVAFVGAMKEPVWLRMA